MQPSASIMDPSAFFDTANPFTLDDDNVTDLFGGFEHLTGDVFGNGDLMNFDSHAPDQDSFSDKSQQNPNILEEAPAPAESTPVHTSATANPSDEVRRTSLPSPDPSSTNNSPHGPGVKTTTQGPCTTTSSGVEQFTAIALSPDIVEQATATTHSPESLQEQSHLPPKFADLVNLLVHDNHELTRRIKELESTTSKLVRGFNNFKVEQAQFVQNSIPVQVQHFLKLHLQNMQQVFAEFKRSPPVPRENPYRMLPPQGNLMGQIQVPPSSVGPPQVPKQSPKRRKTNDGNPSFASAPPTPQLQTNMGIRSTPINPPPTHSQSSLEDVGYPMVSSHISDTGIPVTNSENIPIVYTRPTNSTSGDPFDRFMKASVDLNVRAKRAYAEYDNNPPPDVVSMYERERRDMWHSLPPEQRKKLQERVIEYQALNRTPSSQFSSGNTFTRMAAQNKMLNPSLAPVAPMTHQPGILLPEGNQIPFTPIGGVFGMNQQLDIGVQTSSHDLATQPEGGAQSFHPSTPTFNPHHNMLPVSMMPTGQNLQYHRMMQEQNLPQMPLYSQISPHQQNMGNLQVYGQQLDHRQQIPSMSPYQQNGLYEIPPQMTPQRSQAIVPRTPTRTTPSQPRRSASNKKRKGASESNSTSK